MSFNSTYKIPLPSSRLTQIRQNKMIYANYISKVQANNQGCDTARTGMDDGNVAPGSIVPDLLDGARNTTATERDAVLASTACPVAPTPPPSILTSGLVLYYDAANTSSYPHSGTSVYDLSTSGYTGTLTNGTSFSYINGGTFVFDGSNDYIDTGVPINANSFTLNCWFKTTDVTNYRMMISKENPEPVGSPWNYRMWLNKTTGTLVGDIVAPGGAGTLAVNYSSGPNLADGNWHMTTFSRNATTHKGRLYIDGIFALEDTDNIVDGTNIGNSQNAWIGRSAYNGGGLNGYPWNGNIASFFIYDKAQSDADVLYNYTVTKTRFGF